MKTRDYYSYQLLSMEPAGPHCFNVVAVVKVTKSTYRCGAVLGSVFLGDLFGIADTLLSKTEEVVQFHGPVVWSRLPTFEKVPVMSDLIQRLDNWHDRWEFEKKPQAS